MAGGSSEDRPLTETPAWAVAAVCTVIVVVSVVIEHGIETLHKLFQRRQKKAMLEALEKVKAELMLLGFISLLLTVGQQPISRICVSYKVGHTMLPCKKVVHDDNGGGDDRRKLLWLESQEPSWRRVLAAGASTDYCSKHEGKVSLITQNGIHQLHIFIFVLAVFHVLYSALTMGLAQAKMKTWKAWESETNSLEYQFSHDPARFRLTHQTSFVKRHVGLSSKPGVKWIALVPFYHGQEGGCPMLWVRETQLRLHNSVDSRGNYYNLQGMVKTQQVAAIQKQSFFIIYFPFFGKVAFLRQFFASVTKVDYLTMRHGFINAHLSPNSKFNFHKYIKRSLEDDFKVVVGISLPLWFVAIMIMLLNVYGLYTLFWVSFIPLLILLLVGTKLEMVIMEMAHQIQDRTTVIKGAPIVEPSNRWFWFNHPEWILYLIHLTLFENAFQMAHFLWTWYSFGPKSCFHGNLTAAIAKALMGLALQFVCSYITFPLYALVTQMGSHMKKSIFEEQTARALEKWRRAAKEKKKLREKGLDPRSGYQSEGDMTPSRGTSPLHLLHKHKSSSADVESVLSSPVYQSDNDISEMEAPPFTKFEDHGLRRSASKAKDEGMAGCDFSFSAAS